MEHKENKTGQVARSDEGDPLGLLAEKFQELLNAPRELKRPPGTITVNEYANKTNTNPKRVGECFRRLHKDGKIERTKVGSIFFYSLQNDGEEG